MNKTFESNIDPNEIAKFDAMAKEWWDPEGKMKPLHLLNPLRLQYVSTHASLNSKIVLDVGCGGGILSEAMSKEGATVTGIDLSPEVLKVAKTHAQQQSLSIHYERISVEALAKKHPQSFDVVTCMELLEHVPDPSSVIQACSDLVKPGGSVFFSTINRNLKAYFLAIIGAEYLLNMLPKGTHEYDKLIRPSELSRWAQQASLQLKDVTGIRYQPFNSQFELCQDVSVNYLACFEKTDNDHANTQH
ncbi:bifunctional 2-polyprenyl-6-hydroxyphenol methylase/3-demethylubiquinol 3-O-methyltransferase UbiG [Candidiatus Paracoxiella cheracis]|uniref:bifunctional 2-polyprenyl-6-hydroxyphenol methylase/3-demethylubiquinol 3-O-methyltransferase UbiG n=1 Tax=Candidiatus Paracoxiella cheracis TaxID=3405120 RepID=UPI003BF534E2